MKMRPGFVVVLLWLAAAASGQPYSEATIHSFVPAPNGQRPESALIQAADGSLYGTTGYGGTNNYGTVFRVSGLGGSPITTVIYNFRGGMDGANPLASLIQASDGFLYGTTNGGGINGSGTVFRIGSLEGTPAFNVVYRFTGGADGRYPLSPLIQASDGSLYGTTSSGGASNHGTVFRITGLNGSPVESVVHSFAGGSDGSSPFASVIQAVDGSLYGTTAGGGSSGYGTVFRITDPAGAPIESILYAFTNGADGGDPQAPLIQASDGDLYGTTIYGDDVFRISNPSGTPTFIVLYTFPGGAGLNPVAPLVQASDGNLYGTTDGDSGTNPGTVYRISNLAGTRTETALYDFTGGADGGNPVAGLVQASDGNLYGTTFAGGVSGYGTVFTISNLSGTPTESVVYSFPPGSDGNYSMASLLEASDGNLYGTTYSGGSAGYGTVFRLSNLGGTPTESVIYSFTGGGDGTNPIGALIEASDGNLYGTTYLGGAGNGGTVFRISNLASAPVESVIYSFTGGADGANPNAPLIQASDGDLYGMTQYGGPSNAGTVFQISNVSGTPTESVVYPFNGGADGANPVASLVQASDGNLYGTTSYGGAGGWGTVFRITNIAGPPGFALVHTFTGPDGAAPRAGLIQASDGNLYGTTLYGGAAGSGTVFKLSNLAGTPTESVIYSFLGGVDGSNPAAALMLASDGNLYGTTYYGGSYQTGNLGNVFMIGNLTGTPTESGIYSFGRPDGDYPYSALIQASDGNLYGTTSQDGTGGMGSVYAMVKSCFNDVPTASPFRSFICTIARNGITAGCGGGDYCPAASTQRNQMAVFVLRSAYGPAYVPPPATGTMFADVPANAFAANFIEESALEGIMGVGEDTACGAGLFCPSDAVTRLSMAYILLRGEHGGAYVPPAASCASFPFVDVPCPSPDADFVGELLAEGITAGCDATHYCTGNPVTRAQMAVFLTATFGLQ